MISHKNATINYLKIDQILIALTQDKIIRKIPKSWQRKKAPNYRTFLSILFFKESKMICEMTHFKLLSTTFDWHSKHTLFALIKNCYSNATQRNWCHVQSYIGY
jgi:hypothetical protein